MDILDRLNNRLIETNTQVISDAIDEIMKLRQIKTRRGKMLSDIFNCDAGETLPDEIKQRIDAELMGLNERS